jgi:hypothetical protein
VASEAELGALETMGRPLRRAWFVPFGALSILLVAVLAYVGFASPTSGSEVIGVTFTNINTSQLVPATLDVPQNWDATFFTKPDDQPPPRLEITTTSTGLEKIVLAKFTDSATLADIVVNHFSDQSSLQATGFPSAPPKASCATIGGAPAAYVTIPFSNSGANAQIIMYGFLKGGAAYTLTFVASGGDNITTMDGIAKRAVRTFKFLAGASAAPSASASPSPSPSPSASALPGVTPSPAYTVSCS